MEQDRKRELLIELNSLEDKRNQLLFELEDLAPDSTPVNQNHPSLSMYPINDDEFIQAEIKSYSHALELSHFGGMTTENLDIPLPDFSHADSVSGFHTPLTSMSPNTRDDRRTIHIDWGTYKNYLPNYFGRS